jgi:4-amino-4-deoxy-L-arabinose transferase-like glycosyltransferase
MRTAETDALAALFVTASIFATWRGYEICKDGTPRHRLRSAAWFWAGSTASGLAVMTKGPPGAYVLLLLGVLVVLERQWRALGWWFACGAPLVLLAVAAPWFAYLWNRGLLGELFDDLENSAGGGLGHHEWFFEYFPRLFAVVAPWSGLLGLGIAFAIWERRDARVRGLNVWVLSVLVPLCLWGNKQPHYLLPILPPLLVLVGALVDRAMAGSDRRLTEWTRWVAVATVVVIALGAPTLPFVARAARGHVTPLDVAMAVGMAAWGLAALWLYLARRRRGALALATLGCAATVIAIVTCWEPTLRTDSPRAVVQSLRREFRDGPYAFYGRADSLSLCFELRAVIPRVQEPAEVARLHAREPGVVLIEATSIRAQPSPAPAPFRVVRTLISDERKFVVFASDARVAVPRP